MKLLYAMAFALFPLVAPAQTLDSSLLTALCHDDYFEDTAGQCSSISSDEGITDEAIGEKYGAIVPPATWMMTQQLSILPIQRTSSLAQLNHGMRVLATNT